MSAVHLVISYGELPAPDFFLSNFFTVSEHRVVNPPSFKTVFRLIVSKINVSFCIGRFFPDQKNKDLC